MTTTDQVVDGFHVDDLVGRGHQASAGTARDDWVTARAWTARRSIVLEVCIV